LQTVRASGPIANVPARRLIHPAYHHRAVFRFGVVGIVDLAIDTACVYGLRAALGLYGGMVAYGVAATSTWARSIACGPSGAWAAVQPIANGLNLC
jgi:hypothetical protein